MIDKSINNTILDDMFKHLDLKGVETILLLNRRIGLEELYIKSNYPDIKIYSLDLTGINIFKDEKNVFFMSNEEFLEKGINMKFDVIIGNPPYQRKVGPNNTEPIWDKFVIKTMSLLKPNGKLSLIHPGGWREVKGRFKKIQNLFKSKNMTYLNINNKEKGQITFGAYTDYDYYVIENKDYEGKTLINFDDDYETTIDISDLDFILNDNYEQLSKLMTKYDEEKVEILHDYSTYEHRKCNKERGEYKVIYTLKKNNVINFLYSDVYNKKHFIPKVIFSNGMGEPLVDYNGEYGISEFSYAIIDKVENLKNIEIALNNINFIKLVNKTGHNYDWKIISQLRKDFWKDFI